MRGLILKHVHKPMTRDQVCFQLACRIEFVCQLFFPSQYFCFSFPFVRMFFRCGLSDVDSLVCTPVCFGAHTQAPFLFFQYTARDRLCMWDLSPLEVTPGQQLPAMCQRCVSARRLIVSRAPPAPAPALAFLAVMCHLRQLLERAESCLQEQANIFAAFVK